MRCRFFSAERQAIDHRLSPVKSPSAPDASIRRCRSSHRPTCLRHVGSASLLYLRGGGEPLPAIE
jgi:hypothetical protein